MSRRVHDVEPIVTPLAAPIGGVREDGLDAAQSGVTSENCDPVFAVVPKENGAGAGRTHLKSSRTLATFELIGGGANEWWRGRSVADIGDETRRSSQRFGSVTGTHAH